MPTPFLENTLNQEELQSLIDMYQSNCSLREISRRTNYNRQTLSRMFERLGVKTTKGNHYRKYFFDFDFFEKIDTESKAYWLGFLYADGCILPVNKYGEQAFKLALQEKDIDCIEQFKKDLNSTYPIRKDVSKHNKNPNHSVQVLLEHRSQKTVDDLKKLGCIERKSLILTFPSENQVPSYLINHFIRGYFDGDGSISYSKKQNTYHICFTGTEKFIKKLSSYFNGGSVIKDKRKENSWYFNLGGNLKIIEAYNFMYNNATRYMKRKYDKFQELLLKYSES